MNEYYCASSTTYGFRVLVHTPNENPSVALHGQSVATGYESNMVIMPTISVATQAVRAIPIRLRKCLFDEENFLKYFL